MFALRLATATALSLGMAAGAPAQHPTPVQVINLQSYSYSPTPIRLQAGKPITLEFVNRSRGGHDFTAEKFFQSAKILSGRVEKGEIDLAGGQSLRVTLVPATGTYKVHCGHAFHSALGMRSTIIVQ